METFHPNLDSLILLGQAIVGEKLSGRELLMLGASHGKNCKKRKKYPFGKLNFNENEKPLPKEYVQ
jgi:hypothetical protein